MGCHKLRFNNFQHNFEHDLSFINNIHNLWTVELKLTGVINDISLVPVDGSTFERKFRTHQLVYFDIFKNPEKGTKIITKRINI